MITYYINESDQGLGDTSGLTAEQLDRLAGLVADINERAFAKWMRENWPDVPYRVERYRSAGIPKQDECDPSEEGVLEAWYAESDFDNWMEEAMFELGLA